MRPEANAGRSENVDIAIVLAHRDLMREFSALTEGLQPTVITDSTPHGHSQRRYFRFDHHVYEHQQNFAYRCVALSIGSLDPTATLSDAALQIRHLIQDWNPRTLLFPGIGSQISLKPEVKTRLGDVVVSRSLYADTQGQPAVQPLLNF